MNASTTSATSEDAKSRVARILVVEDERIVARSLRVQLERLGYEITGTVPSGHEALQHASDHPPDLVLMDIRLEGDLDGVETAAEIRKRFQLPVVYLTSYSNKEVLDRAKLTEPYGYILKPYEERELHVVIETALYKNQMERLALKERNIEFQRAVQTKDRFLESMSHDFRTPLNAVIGYVGVLLMKHSGTLTPLQEGQLRIVESSANELLSLLSGLLDVAKIESGKVELNLDPILFQSVLATLVEKLETISEVQDPPLSVAASLPDDVAWTDRRVMSRILNRLISNSVKFVEEGTVRLEMNQRQESGRLRTEVRLMDIGTNISPDEQAKIATTFAQLDASDRSLQRSTGLGMYLMIRRLAALMGAEITIQNEAGKGSAFTLAWNEDLGSDPAAL